MTSETTVTMLEIDYRALRHERDSWEREAKINAEEQDEALRAIGKADGDLRHAMAWAGKFGPHGGAGSASDLSHSVSGIIEKLGSSEARSTAMHRVVNAARLVRKLRDPDAGTWSDFDAARDELDAALDAHDTGRADAVGPDRQSPEHDNAGAAGVTYYDGTAVDVQDPISFTWLRKRHEVCWKEIDRLRRELAKAISLRNTALVDAPAGVGALDLIRRELGARDNETTLETVRRRIDERDMRIETLEKALDLVLPLARGYSLMHSYVKSGLDCVAFAQRVLRHEEPEADATPIAEPGVTLGVDHHG